MLKMRPVEIGTRERGLAPLVLVTGGKGGVGKTTIATNLGVPLARNGKRVLLVDLDLGLSNVDVMLRLSPARTMEDALEGRCAFEDCLIDGPSGLKVLPAGSASMRMRISSTQDRGLKWGLLALTVQALAHEPHCRQR